MFNRNKLKQFSIKLSTGCIKRKCMSPCCACSHYSQFVEPPRQLFVVRCMCKANLSLSLSSSLTYFDAIHTEVTRFTYWLKMQSLPLNDCIWRLPVHNSGFTTFLLRFSFIFAFTLRFKKLLRISSHKYVY